MIDVCLRRFDGTDVKRSTAQSIDKILAMVNRILIVRHEGGLGDVMMMRLMFEDVKTTFQGEVHFAAPPSLISIVEDHPFLDACVPSAETQNLYDDKLDATYGLVVDVNSACVEHEMKFKSDVCENRSDLWARSMGVELVNHRAHVKLAPRELNEARTTLSKICGAETGVVLIAPRSTSSARDLTDADVRTVAELLKDAGRVPVLLHPKRIELGLPQLSVGKPRQLLAIVAVASGVVSTDTGPAHVAGALGSPVLAAFGYTSGKVVMKHYPSAVLLEPDTATFGCAPCYAWSSCVYAKLDAGAMPVRCLRSFSKEAWEAGISQLLSLSVAPLYVEEEWVSKRKTMSEIAGTAPGRTPGRTR